MLIKRKENIFGDNIAYLESYDFSKANMSNETRLDIITLVASICYQSPKAHGSESLYNRLMAESGGLPSSSFEFVPVLLQWGEVIEVCQLIEDTIQEKDENGEIIASYIDTQTPNIEKYGEWIEVDGCKYLLTNFRAIVYDFEQYGDRGVDLRDRFNTEAECAIIAKHFKVFKMKVDMPTFGQAVRHRVNWQVLSRRYVSGTRVPFDFYVSEKMRDLKLPHTSLNFNSSTRYDIDMDDFLDLSIAMYEQALKQGIKPQVARGIIPQCAYTTAWCAMQPKQFDSFKNLRSDSHAQWEIQQLSNAMKELTDG